jgi:hypothetical protein
MRYSLLIALLCLIVLFATLGEGAARSGAQQSLQTGRLGSKVIDERGSALNMSIISWNMAEVAPNTKDCAFIRGYRSSDIVVFGIQECEDIRPRRREGHRTRLWRELQRKLLGRQFQCIGSHKMGGLFLSVYAKQTALEKIRGVQLVDVACGVGNVLTNKGAVGAILRFGNKTVALVNSHLAAHQKYVSV